MRQSVRVLNNVTEMVRYEPNNTKKRFSFNARLESRNHNVQSNAFAQ